MMARVARLVAFGRMAKWVPGQVVMLIMKRNGPAVGKRV